MEVCHIISAFGRYDTRIFWKQSISLSRAGYTVSIITNDNIKSEIKEGIRIIPSGFNNTGRINRILFARKYSFRKALEVNADIFQIHDPEFIPIGLRLKKKGKLVLYDSHEDFPRQILEKDWIPAFLRKTLSYLAEAYLNRSLKRFDAILTVTPHIVESMSRTLKNVHLITNYPIAEESPSDFSFDEYIARGSKLCYAGTVYRSSLQQNVIESVDSIKDVEYIIVGTIDAKYKAELSLLPDNKNVKFIDHIPKNELNQIYRKVSVGIAIFDYSPNLGYKTGSLGVNKIFEYMSFGLPVICTDFVLWKEIIDKYKCGIYINPHSIHEISEAIKYLINNSDEAYRMGLNGKKAIDIEYNWKSQENKYLEIIGNIAEKRVES